MKTSSKALQGKLDKQLYSPEVFRKASRVERIYMVLVMGPRGQFALTETEQEYLSLMENAYTLVKERRSQTEALKLFRAQMQRLTHRPHSAIAIMRDALNLFGRFEDVHRPVQRGMIREQLLRRIEVCEKACTVGEGDSERSGDAPLYEKLIQGYWKQLIELDQLDRIEDGPGDLDNEIPDIEFTSDAAALMDHLAEDAEIDTARG